MFSSIDQNAGIDHASDLEALPSPVSKSLHPVTSTSRKVDSDIKAEDQSLPYAGIDHQPSLSKQTYEPDLPLLKSKHISVLKLPQNQFMSLQTSSDSDDSSVRIVDSRGTSDYIV